MSVSSSSPGVPRFGDQAVMAATQTPAADLESIVVAGRACALNLKHTLSPISGVTFAKAEETLKTAMADLRGWSAQRVADGFAPQSAEAPYTIELDMDHDDWMDEVQRAASGVIEPLDADGPSIAQSVPLDPLTVIDDPGYFARFDRIAPPFLSSLKGFYEHP